MTHLRMHTHTYTYTHTYSHTSTHANTHIHTYTHRATRLLTTAKETPCRFLVPETRDVLSRPASPPAPRRGPAPSPPIPQCRPPPHPGRCRLHPCLPRFLLLSYQWHGQYRHALGGWGALDGGWCPDVQSEPKQTTAGACGRALACLAAEP
eukprot:1147401-Pelagomonas_calceolata.AAC.4